MRLISFDIECAKAYENDSPICNFGYVIYDMDYNLLEKRDIIINPKSNFKLEGRKNQKDIKLFYTEKEYKREPTFDKYYDEIKSILEFKDQIIVNHAVSNDIKYLANDCRRYKLPIINFYAYDTIDIYKALENNEKALSLENIAKNFLDGKEFVNHKADEDADIAICFFIRICLLLEVKPHELIDLAEIKPLVSSKNSYITAIKKNKNLGKKKNNSALILRKHSLIRPISNYFENKKRYLRTVVIKESISSCKKTYMNFKNKILKDLNF